MKKWIVLALAVAGVVAFLRPQDESVPAAVSGSAPPLADVVAALLDAALAEGQEAAPAREAEPAALPPDPLSWTARQREQAARSSNPLHKAAADGRESGVRALLEGGADPNALHRGLNFGWTPLHAAAGGGHARIARILMVAGADPDIAEFSGQTPLHFAAINGRAEVVRALLDWNADPNIADSEGATPLARAVEFGRADIARMLRAAGAR